MDHGSAIGADRPQHSLLSDCLPAFEGIVATVKLLRGDMNINWRLKSSIFRVIDSFSLYKILYLLQKYVTGRSTVSITAVNPNWVTHVANLETISRPAVLEFGAGKSLAQNIYLSSVASTQTVVDLFDMIDISQFDDAARQISTFSDVPYHRVNTLSDIEAKYAIRYIAPFDVTQTDYSDGTFDACISTNTLEHIPEESIVSIFRELKRIIRPGGLISAVIDYSDHYAHTDRNISYLNFLTFSAAEFARHNHSVHYQNRLRHSDYERIFTNLGFEVLRNETLNPVELPEHVSSEFDTKNPTITATKGIFLLAVPTA